MDSVPANADVHVEINQNTPVGLESQIEIQPQQQSSANSTSSTTTSTNSETEGSQFRVTTATHPTTSTQTRSTARPHATTGIPVGQIRNLRPAMQLSSFDRYLPCNSHHIHEPENQQQQQRQSQQSSQQQQQQQQITPRANRINIQRAPQVHIQRSVPNSVRFANFLSNHLQNQLQQRSTAAPTTVSSAPTTPIQTSAPPSASLSSNSLNDMQLNTVIPIFGSNQIQLQIRDLVNVSPTPSTLNRIRSELREYLMAKLSLSSSPSEENVALAVNHVISLLNQFFLLLPDLSIPDYDARASIENLIRRTLPFMISLIRDDESVEFGTRMLREISEFSKRFIVILLHSIGRPSAQDYLKNVVETIFTSIFATTANDDTPRVALQWLRRHIYEEILRRFQEIRLDSIDVIEFLVIRRPPPPTPTDQRQGDLMETDADDDANNETMNAEASEPAEDVELPTITFGSESWHSNFPDPWLPIITRDISRQRRQSPQRPFSDAYLSGMSSKRRKLINNSKPTAAGPNNILPQSVRQVLQSRISHGSSGASTSSASMASTAASIDDAISTNQHINEPYGSYETAILSHVQNRIRTDSNFTPERFPNCVESADFSLQFLKNAESNDEYKCLDVDRWVIHNAMVSSSCSRRTNRRAIQLFVKLLDNHTITLHTETTANVDNLKSIIEDKSKINKRVQLLFFSSKKLESTHSLEFYGIVNYSTIELSIKLSGGSDDQPNQVVPSMSGPPSSEEGSSLQSSSPEQSNSSSSDGDFSSDNWTCQVVIFLNIATPHSHLFTPEIRNGMVETRNNLLRTVPSYNPQLSNWSGVSNLGAIRLNLLNSCSTLLDLLQHRTLRDELGEDASFAVETSLRRLQNSLR